MTARTTTPSEADFFGILARLHGHRCPMSILGARLGLAARDALAPKPGERLAARYLHQTCALDGIQLATGCTLGNGNLTVDRRGEHRLLLWVEGAAAGVEAHLTPLSLERGKAYASLRDRGEEGREMEEILRGLETAPGADLVEVRAGAPTEA